VRSRAFTTDLKTAISELGAKGVAPQVVFLEASDEALVRRFENVRRPHRCRERGRIVDGSPRSAAMLRSVRGDRRHRAGHLLAERPRAARQDERAYFGGGSAAGAVRLTIMSFGYKYGLPVDADLVADCRFLPNPHWVPELRPLTGQDAPVREYVLAQPAAPAFLDAYSKVLEVSLAGFEREGKRFVTLAVGCTGGKHRSVAMPEQLAARIPAAACG